MNIFEQSESLAEKNSVMPKVFVVIINWNGDRDAIACLNSMLSLDYKNCHVILSDNGSSKESIQALRDWKVAYSTPGPSNGIASLEILENDKNLGFTGANTVGINVALAKGADYVLFLNNDTVVTSDFLSRMVATAEVSASVGIVGCKIFSTDTDLNGRHRIWSLGGYSFVMGMPINIGGGQLDSPRWTGRKAQPLINGCCMLIKRGVIETAGVQDDRLFFGVDDVEYSLRAGRNGWKNFVDYDAVIYHAGSQSVTPRSGLQVYYNFRNAMQFRVRNFPWYRNVIFFIYFVFRYIIGGSTKRWITKNGKVNRGVYYAVLDFCRGETGECKHVAAIKD